MQRRNKKKMQRRNKKKMQRRFKKKMQRRNKKKMMNMSVNTSGSRPEMRPMMMKSAAMMDAAPAPIEGGESRLLVNVSGSIQLAE